ncbi:MAG: hypothetical protein NTW87_22245 [Planctomycetota bacterium]|nr:hypothetical protein [Planctomycetota bacterium]
MKRIVAVDDDPEILDLLRAAQELRVSRSTLYAKAARYGIRR